MKPLILWGATGQAKVLKEFAATAGYEVVAIFDNNFDTPAPFANIPIYYKWDGFLQWRASAKIDKLSCLVAIGGTRGYDRVEIGHSLETEGCELVSVVHPTAFVATDAIIAKGCQILAKSAVCTEVRMGEGCIINTSASVDHETILGVGVHIAPGATLAGSVEVGNYSMIGTGAVVLPRICIGQNVVVGAGSVVTKNIPDNKIAYGNPARVIRDNLN
jgi:sugar O-acyltransferase (sialic acid O-acetyltransferase NeuD family)